MKCVSNKKSYPTLEVAQEALIHAWTTYNFAPGTGPVAIYKCEDCGQFHFTSKGEMNPKLKQLLAEGKIQLQREGNFWLGKMKK